MYTVIYTSYNLFFSTKTWPLLYPLHINTKFASENGDKTVLLFKFEEQINNIYVNKASYQNISFHFGYPGKSHKIFCYKKTKMISRSSFYLSFCLVVEVILSRFLFN